MRWWLAAPIVLIAIGVAMIAITRATEACPASWEGAQRVEISRDSATAYIRMDAFHLYAVSGSALLDYMPHPVTFLSSADMHPLSVTLHISGTREDLRDALYTCVVVHHGADTWTTRPQNLDINSPQGVAGPSDRIASAVGPEWPAGDQIDMEAWLQVGTQRFVVVFPPFALFKGG
jgi:hypothetical protein